MTQPMDMGQMLGLLINLKGLEERKKSREAQQTQFDQSLAQAAEQLGIDKNDTRFKQVMALLKTVSETSSKAREAISGLGETFGWSPEQIASVRQFALSAPETVESIRDQAATAGRAAATPLQIAQMNREAAFTATTGMSQGGAAQSGVQAFLGSDGQRATLEQMWSEAPQNFADHLRRGFVTQQANPMQGSMEEAGIAGGLSARGAGIQFGGDLTAAQEGGLNLQAQGLGLERIRMTQAQEAEAARIRGETGLTMNEIIGAFAEMRLTANQMANPDLSDELRELARRRHNSQAALLQQPHLAAPKKGQTRANAFEAYMNQYGWRDVIGQPTPMGQPGQPMPGQPTISAPTAPPIVPDMLRQP